MKLSTLLLLMAALQLTLVIFGERYDQTPLMLLISNPFDWSGLGFFTFLGVLAGGVLAGVALVGTLVFGKNDLAVFASAVAVFIGCCIPVASLWNVINKEVGYWGNYCVSTSPLCSNNMIATMICAPLVIYSMITIVNWWRSASDIN